MLLSEPSSWVRRWTHLIPSRGRVLDLACGHGRHARFLAALGCHVVACDRDSAALAGLAGLRGIEPFEADLESDSPWPFGGRVFDGVVVINYLHRPLFADIAAAVAPGGVLIYETFAQGNERYGKPSNPAFLLRRDELSAAFGRDLMIAGFEQGRVNGPKPSLIQRLCAVRSKDFESDLNHPSCA